MEGDHERQVQNRVCLFASLAVLGGAVATYVAMPASAITTDCSKPCSFNFGPGSTFASGSNEVGLRFQTDVDGWIAAVCFWESPAETGTTHTVSLWDSTGTKVAKATGAGMPRVI